MAELVIAREFLVSRDVLFKVCSQSEHLVKWWGGGWYPICLEKFDLCPEGKFVYSGVEGNPTEDVYTKSYAMFVYKEILSPEKLVFISGFADENHEFTKASFCTCFPFQVLNKWTFTEDTNGKAMLTIHNTPYNASLEEEEYFSHLIPNMQVGFARTFDTLDAYLSAANLSMKNDL